VLVLLMGGIYGVRRWDGLSMIYVPSFIKIGSDIQKLLRVDTHRDRRHCDLISLFVFSQNKENRLGARGSVVG
jgi:hypothetical protein